MFNDKYHAWMTKCVNLIQKRKRNVTAAALSAVIIAIMKKQKKRSYTPKRYWIEPVFRERNLYGFYDKIFPVLQLEDLRFRNYFRMSLTQFEELLSIIGPHIYKEFLIREAVSPGERLAITLRYLASGDMMSSIQYQYLRGLTTISNIIKETCEAIWFCLNSLVLPPKLKKEEWLSIANNFEQLWNFNHCIGAIDGKHVVIQCPGNSGSSYYNYKGTHSIVLLAICDANYVFRYVDIGAFGRGSDSTIFKNSTVGRRFNSKQMNLPDPAPLSVEGPALPYCLVGDEGFPLTDYLLRPYPGKGLTKEREIYNYRLSRARRIIENTFGILASQWRIFRRPIICKVETAEKIIQATVCLHNWLREKDIYNDQYVPPELVDRYSGGTLIPGTWNSLREDGWAFQEITRAGTNSSTRTAISIRDEFCAYFNGECAISWQYDRGN